MESIEEINKEAKDLEDAKDDEIQKVMANSKFSKFNLEKDPESINLESLDLAETDQSINKFEEAPLTPNKTRGIRTDIEQQDITATN